MAETFKFEAEINQLMHLIVNAFYSDKDIFLRELISNSSDALDKIRFLKLTNGTPNDTFDKYEIKVIPDTSNNQLIIEDTGIGMTREELIKNLGTIARSGTKNFIELIKKDNDFNLIGQFGVGFYSAYLVGNKIDVISKSNNDTTYKWSSDAKGEFTVEPYDDPSLIRGTRIIIHLKDDYNDYLEETTLRQIICKHSNYINYPVYLYCKKTREVEESESSDKISEESKVSEEKDSEPYIEDDDFMDDDQNNDSKKNKKTETYFEFEQLNKIKPIWTKNTQDITEDEYKNFYQSLTDNKWEEYMFVKHFKTEGDPEFTGLFYIPSTAPFDMFDSKRKRKNVKLYVRRVFITDNCEELVPDYLSFLRGIIDSNDLPLNVSRELLQKNSSMKKMKKHLVKKCLDMLLDCCENDPEKYNKFYDMYSKNIKLGIHEDSLNREKLIKLLKFFTANHKESSISLKKYVEEMKDDQKDIYYLTGESQTTLNDSPFMEALREKNYDVLFLTDPIDEYAVQNIKEFEGKKLVDISRENFDNNDKNQDSNLDNVCKYIESVLKDKISKVSYSTRVTKSPCVLVTPQYGWSANMERIMKAQALRDNRMASLMAGKKILEINPNHHLIKYIGQNYENNDKLCNDIVQTMYDTACLSSGFTLENPTRYASTVYQLMSTDLLSTDSFSVSDTQEKESKTENNQITSTESLD